MIESYKITEDEDTVSITIKLFPPQHAEQNYVAQKLHLELLCLLEERINAEGHLIEEFAHFTVVSDKKKYPTWIGEIISYKHKKKIDEIFNRD